MSFIGDSLFKELNPKFFGILSSPNAAVYLNVFDALAREMPRRGGALERNEALTIIDQTLLLSRSYQQEDADGEENEPVSAAVLRRLLGAGWLEEERRADYKRLISPEVFAEDLLELFRSSISKNIASFTGKLGLVCNTLGALRDEQSLRNLSWEDLKNCLSQARSGLRELRLIRKQVEKYSKRQGQVNTLAEALDLIYNEFSQFITQRCYRELILARLPERLREARLGLNRLELDVTALETLSRDLRRLEPDAANPLTEVTTLIEDLADALGDVEPTADHVDNSAADFARRSRARIRYIQDVGSRRQQQVKFIFDWARERLSVSGTRELERELCLPDARLTDSGLLGMNSLSHSRRIYPRAKPSPVIAPLTVAELEHSKREMSKNMRDALRLDRANKFVEKLGLPAGGVMSSAELPVKDSDDILDVISCLVFSAARGVNYELRTRRELHPREETVFDAKAGFDIERFEVEKK